MVDRHAKDLELLRKRGVSSRTNTLTDSGFKKLMGQEKIVVSGVGASAVKKRLDLSDSLENLSNDKQKREAGDVAMGLLPRLSLGSAAGQEEFQKNLNTYMMNTISSMGKK